MAANRKAKIQASVCGSGLSFPGRANTSVAPAADATGSLHVSADTLRVPPGRVHRLRSLLTSSVLILAAALLSCKGATPVSNGLPGSIRQYTVTIEGQKRSARIYVPAGYEESSLPVILLLHGSGSDGPSVENQSGMSRAAQRKGFIVVYPDALPLDPSRPPGPENPRVWADGTGRGYSGRNPQNDILFIQALHRHLKKELNIDASRFHLAGFSNGGSMSFRLATEMPELFGRLAVVAGVSWTEEKATKRPDLLYITGKQDTVIPPNRKIGQLPHATTDRTTSVSQTLLQWMDDCSARRSTGPYLPMEIRHRSTMFRCSNHSVQYLELPMTGHVWPGGADDPVGELNATAYIVGFLLDRQRQAHLLDE